MTSTEQRKKLQRQIWQIANEVRGSVDGWDFKQYVLGTMFYRFISENFAAYIEGGDESINYAELADDLITAEIKDDAIAKNDYNLSVCAYVEAEDTREVIDIIQLNAELKTTVAKIDQLRFDIDAIVADLECAK